MFIPVIITVVVYTMLVFFCAKKLEEESTEEIHKQLNNVDQKYKRLVDKRDELFTKKLEFGNEAHKIFTLYEITKEITQSLNEEIAFEIFKLKIKEHVLFEECYYLDPLSEEIKEYRKSPENFVLTLQGKSRRIGYLVVKGMPEEDQDKLIILSHQFALALRRVKLYEEIERIAITDSLTEVHTRRHTLDRFLEEIKRSKMRKIKMSFLMIDVDYFKKINDTYGHLTGDQVLREVATIIKENIREIDIAGRFGGEEFCVVLPDTDSEGAQYAAERIRDSAEKTTIKAYDANIHITLSLGISTFPGDGKEREELIDKADWALYRAKKQGRNRICAFGIYNKSEEEPR